VNDGTMDMLTTFIYDANLSRNIRARCIRCVK